MESQGRVNRKKGNEIPIYIYWYHTAVRLEGCEEVHVFRLKAWDFDDISFNRYSPEPNFQVPLQDIWNFSRLFSVGVGIVEQNSSRTLENDWKRILITTLSYCQKTPTKN